MRTQKTVGSTVYNYYYIDGLLVRQTWGSNYIDFLYDESGSAYSFIYNGTQYYYIKNLQGDVMRIVDAMGSVVANYFYDAWGKVTSSGNIVGLYNPIRYRGYYYDTDTGFYYLQSRYYDPVVKRFINADSYVSTGDGILGFNMYVYSLNNPINYLDKKGTHAETISQNTPQILSILSMFLSVIDGPLPIGDILGLGLLALSIAISYPNDKSIVREALKDKILADVRADEKTIVIDRVQTDSNYNYWAADLIDKKIVIQRPLTV